jgi:hypothetical protein
MIVASILLSRYFCHKPLHDVLVKKRPVVPVLDVRDAPRPRQVFHLHVFVDTVEIEMAAHGVLRVVVIHPGDVVQVRLKRLVQLDAARFEVEGFRLERVQVLEQLPSQLLFLVRALAEKEGDLVQGRPERDQPLELVEIEGLARVEVRFDIEFVQRVVGDDAAERMARDDDPVVAVLEEFFQQGERLVLDVPADWEEPRLFIDRRVDGDVADIADEDGGRLVLYFLRQSRRQPVVHERRVRQERLEQGNHRKDDAHQA